MAATAVACQKESCTDRQSEEGREIVFNLCGEGIDFDVQTRATEVTSVSTVYWEALNNSSGTVVHEVSSYSVSSGKVSTGKYWPYESVSYLYRVANVPFTTSTGEISATNDTDIVIGDYSNVSYDAYSSCNITLGHIFARTGTLTLNAKDDYIISDVSWTIKSYGRDSGTAGTYTFGKGWGSSATTSLTEQAITSSSDLYLIPGSYTLTATYTLTKGLYTHTFTKSAEVSLTMGCVNSITGTVSGNASEISFSVSVKAWESKTLTPTFS